jgi:predicted TPR repeat methyltransferase
MILPIRIAGIAGRTMGKGREFLDRIYALEEQGDVRSFYDEAAGDYDQILLAQVGYVSPTVCAHAMARFLTDKHAPLIDLGCGTGLAGEALAALGYSHIDGVDFSTEMLAVAQARNCYTRLSLADLNAGTNIPERSYAAAMSVGVFGQHVLPGALDEAIRIIEPGGIFCFSVNERAFDDFGFREKVDALTAEDQASCLSLTKEPYHVNENIDGWVCCLRIAAVDS